LEGCRLVTLDLITCGAAMGPVESERIGPLRLGGPMRMSMAGAESTVAIGVVRLGGSARWVGVVGDDEVGQLVRRTASAVGVKTDGVVTDPDRPSSLMLKERRTAPVGAGDSFAAGLLADLARGRPPRSALETAAAVAAINVGCPGDWERLPTRAEVDLLRGTDVLR
jgi:sugar/nucleoside kinase (ribokinase family)